MNIYIYILLIIFILFFLPKIHFVISIIFNNNNVNSRACYDEQFEKVFLFSITIKKIENLIFIIQLDIHMYFKAN